LSGRRAARLRVHRRLPPGQVGRATTTKLSLVSASGPATSRRSGPRPRSWRRRGPRRAPRRRGSAGSPGRRAAPPRRGRRRRSVRRVPALPRPHPGVAGAEHEPATVDERRPDRSERRPQLLVGHQHLEHVARHDRQRELPVPGHLRRPALDPLDVAAPARPLQRREVRVDPAQPPAVPGLPGPVQQPPGAAADVHDRRGVHHPRQVGVVARPPRVEDVVEGGGIGIGIHRAVCRTGRSGFGTAGALRRTPLDPSGTDWPAAIVDTLRCGPDVRTTSRTLLGKVTAWASSECGNSAGMRAGWSVMYGDPGDR
jgi:hypothetical protein